MIDRQAVARDLLMAVYGSEGFDQIAGIETDIVNMAKAIGVYFDELEAWREEGGWHGIGGQEYARRVSRRLTAMQATDAHVAAIKGEGNDYMPIVREWDCKNPAYPVGRTILFRGIPHRVIDAGKQGTRLAAIKGE